MIIRGIGSLLFLLFCLNLSFAQGLDDFILKNSFAAEAQELYADPLGSFYLVNKKRSITKYSADGKLLFRYSNNRLGDIGWMDVSDPFHLQLYFPDFRTLVLLDNDLGELESYDLQELGLYDSPAAGLSYDNNFWLFDNNTGQVKKINQHGEILLESDNLFYELKETPKPFRLLETKRYVLLMDKLQGTFVFDQFGKYLRKLKQQIPSHFQIRNDRIIYFDQGKLIFIGLKDGRVIEIRVPASATTSHVQYTGDRLFSLDNNQVNIYQLNMKK